MSGVLASQQIPGEKQRENKWLPFSLLPPRSDHLLLLTLANPSVEFLPQNASWDKPEETEPDPSWLLRALDNQTGRMYDGFNTYE